MRKFLRLEKRDRPLSDDKTEVETRLTNIERRMRLIEEDVRELRR